MQVFLVHGMGRTPRSFAVLAWRLERAGVRVSRFGYTVRRDPLAHIAARLAAHVREHAVGPYVIVGHSLGNVVARLATPELPEGLAGMVMLAPPNRPSRLAAVLRDRAIFRALTGDAGQRLGDPAFYDALPIPPVPIVVFAGTIGPRAAWLPFEGAISDGIVALDETRLEGADHREIAAIHTLIMNDAQVAEAILELVRRAGQESRG